MFYLLYQMVLNYLVYVIPIGLIVTIICVIMLDKDNKL